MEVFKSELETYGDLGYYSVYEYLEKTKIYDLEIDNHEAVKSARMKKQIYKIYFILQLKISRNNRVIKNGSAAKSFSKYYLLVLYITISTISNPSRDYHQQIIIAIP